jgi:hypothetical protein
MTPENPSVLGYVFIIGGIALAILAYWIYINLREDKAKVHSKTMVKNSNAQTDSSPFEGVAVLSDEPLMETPDPSFFDKDPPPTEGIKNLSQIQSSQKESTGENMPKQQELVSVVNILREIDTGNLILRIGGKDYTRFEDLKDSPHLSRILRLSTDLDQWLKPAAIPGRKKDRSVTRSKAPATDSFTPRSMVEEINEILERKLEEESGEKKAIKLVEMPDGGVNVYIGVDSYPIDEVPFEHVQKIIRQAVSEWEQKR